VDHCARLGLSVATFYAFSTENWKRPPKEVNAIMKLMDSYLSECEKKLDQYDFRLCFLGDKSAFDEKRRTRMERLEELTKGNARILNIALNYGGRSEITRAFNKLAEDGKREISEADITAALYTSESPELDMVVRTGGDLRISNFLLWQTAYAELYFTDKLWPDLTPDDVDAAVEVFKGRQRRFGGA
jgi:undecaprenyl diphosphate synthase